MTLASGPNLGALISGAQGEQHFAEFLRLLRTLDALVQSHAKDRDLATPPGSPADGDTYVVAASATGAWSGQEAKVARWNDAGAAWEFYTPRKGWRVWLQDEDVPIVFNGAAWALEPSGGGGGGGVWGSITGTLGDQSDLAAALALLATIASPTFTGTPAAPTAAPGTNTTQISTTAFVQAAIAALVDSSPGTLDTLNELAAALGDDPNFATTIAASIALKAPIASPTFTGTPAAPTASPGTNTTQLATTAFVEALGVLKANLASPTFTGTPAAPTATAGTNTTQLATTAFANAAAAAIHPAPTPLDWSGGGVNLHPFLGVTSGARVGVTPTASRQYYLIGRPIGRVRVTAPTVEIQTATADSYCRAGLCEWDTVNGEPGDLLVDWGTADTSSTGTKTFTNGSTTYDLDPSKAYGLIFNPGGPSGAAGYYYASFAPSAVPLFVNGVSPMVISIYDNGESTQLASGFNDPPSAFAALVAETSANAPGWRNFVQFTVTPTP